MTRKMRSLPTGGTSSKQRKQVWDLLIENPNMSVAKLASRVGLKPDSIRLAIKYFREVTTFLAIEMLRSRSKAS